MASRSERDPTFTGRGASRRLRLRAAATTLTAAAIAVCALVLLAGDETGTGETPARVQPAHGASDPTAPAEVWAVGDGADGLEPGKRVGRMIAAARPARLLYLGDVYYTGSRSEFDQNYHPAYGGLAHRTLPTPGNHDWARHAEGYHPYWKETTGRTIPSAYGTRVGGWEIISLNSETVSSDPAQVSWLRNRVASGGTCRIAFWHRPRFSAGRHGDAPAVDPFWQTLRGRAALVLNGHEHNMQELRPRNGIRELIAGAGGRSHYGIDPGDTRVAWANTTAYGALRLRLSPGIAR